MKNKKAKYLNPNLTVEERVKDLQSKMTLEEKIAQITSCIFSEIMEIGNSNLIEDMKFSRKKADKRIKNGIGQVSLLPYFINKKPEAIAELINEIQGYLINNTRLGIPTIVFGECIAGLNVRGATSYPPSINQASTWENELVYKMADQIRKQMRAIGILYALSPNLDISRDPRWGRVEENYGEDTYLCSSLGVSFVKGLQGKDLLDGIAATGKHFFGHGMSEGGMNTASVKLSTRELLENFVVPFEAVIREAGVLTIMPAYHDLDGIPVTSSREILTDFLRSKLKFDGLVTSDAWAISRLKTQHQIAKDLVDAGKLALKAGVDFELPLNECWGEEFTKEVKKGSIDLNLVEKASSRQLTLKFKLGLFDNPYVETSSVSWSFGTKQQKEFSKHLARKSIILLKNNKNILPLKNDIKSIAVIGPNADNLRNQLSGYSYQGFQEVVFEEPEIINETVKYNGEIDISGVSILEGIKEKLPTETEVLYTEGCKVLDESTDGFQSAIKIAEKVEVAVVVLGEKSGGSKKTYNTCGEGRDRASIKLPGVQGELLRKIAATNTPIILILLNGRPLGIHQEVNLSSAVIEAWFPGEQGGRAVADVLFGDYNPGGKLPITVPKTVGQIPLYYNKRTGSVRSENDVGYVDQSADPLFPFGFGLSYTEFEFSNIRINKKKIKYPDKIEIIVDIKNTGKVKGEEVIQLYIRDIIAEVSRPIKELKGYKRISLEVGEKKSFTFILYSAQLAFYNREMKLVVEPGYFKIMVGNSSQDIKLTGEFEVIGEVSEVDKEHRVFFSFIR